jgi:hypothetical protein
MRFTGTELRSRSIMVLFFLASVFGSSKALWSQKGCNIAVSEVQQIFAPGAQASVVSGDPCKFSFFDPKRASHGAFTLEIRPHEATGVSNAQFAESVADLRSHGMLCRMELGLGARAAFCYDGKNAELLILNKSVISAMLAGNHRGPNPTRDELIELAKIVFDVESGSAPLEKPQD